MSIAREYERDFGISDFLIGEKVILWYGGIDVFFITINFLLLFPFVQHHKSTISFPHSRKCLSHTPRIAKVRLQRRANIVYTIIEFIINSRTFTINF